MEEQKQEPGTPEPLEDLFEPTIGDIPEEMIQELMPLSSEKQRLVEKRRLAERRLE